jgi:hypothetical protein
MSPDVHVALGAVCLAAYIAAMNWALRPLRESTGSRRAVARRDADEQAESDRQRQYKLFGAIYGFPACCVQAFCSSHCSETRVQYPDGPWMGTGFVPCITCAPAALDFDRFIAEKVAPARICPSQFPSELSGSAVDAALAVVAEMELSAKAGYESLPRQ